MGIPFIRHLRVASNSFFVEAKAWLEFRGVWKGIYSFSVAVLEQPENSTTRFTSGHILVLIVWMTQRYFHWINLKGKKSYSIGRMVHYKNWKRQTKCYYDHKQIHKIPDNPWKNRRKITRPWPYHTFISRHSNQLCSFLWPLKVIHTQNDR